MGRLWQAAATVRVGAAARAAGEGGRGAGCAACSSASRPSTRRTCARSTSTRTWAATTRAAVRRLHDLGVMVNASFVFGMDEDDPDVFDRTVEWAIEQGIETATFHILTPYPGTALHRRLEAEGRMLHRDWDLYDTRHAVLPARADDAGASSRRATGGPTGTSTAGARSSGARPRSRPWQARLRHVAYAAGWKKFEPLWDLLIRGGVVGSARPLLERVLENPLLRGPGDRRRARRQTELGPDVGDVAVNGVAAEVQAVRDLLVRQPLRHEAQHLDFS